MSHYAIFVLTATLAACVAFGMGVATGSPVWFLVASACFFTVNRVIVRARRHRLN